jgi:hypothetical protein
MIEILRSTPTATITTLFIILLIILATVGVSYTSGNRQKFVLTTSSLSAITFTGGLLTSYNNILVAIAFIGLLANALIVVNTYLQTKK